MTGRSLVAELPGTMRTARQYVAQGACRSVEAAVCLAGGPLAAIRAGDTGAGHPLWTCASKSVLALCVARLVSRGALSFADRIVTHLPVLDSHTWADVRLGDVLCHAVPLRQDVGAWSVFRDDEEVLRRLRGAAAAPRTAGGVYLRWTNFFLIGQVVASVTGQRWEQCVRREVLGPLGLGTTQMTFPAARLAELEEFVRSPATASSGGSSARATDAGAADPGLRPRTDRTWAGMSASGTMADLALALAALLPEAEERGIAPWVRAEMTRVHNQDTASIEGNPLHWGLGVMVDPRIGGPRCSAATFGYLGHNGTLAVLADPGLGLSVAVSLSGSRGTGLPVALRRAALIQAAVDDALAAGCRVCG